MTATHEKAARAHYYRLFRGNMERSAESAFQSARSHMYFRERLREMVRKPKRRKRAPAPSGRRS